MRITQDEAIQFCDALIAKVWQTHSAADIELKRAPSGHFLVILHTDKDRGSLQCESECYTIDPISREWIKTYGEI
ncbi:hypothetical protein phiK7A1_106 [Pseudomonas phage phiK7A1]|uniref:Uncharacterized protein n=1 Tax=Pseudomonas phage phiK7A1 TaxID=2759194 RepID=A0A7H0XFV4_9CAUD|nr:hypothetical protein phiK7A1_106 [Pseudomonas phage phiK7A1]